MKLTKKALVKLIKEEIKSMSEAEVEGGPLAAREKLIQAFGAGKLMKVTDEDDPRKLKDMIVLQNEADVTRAMELKDIIEGDFDWYIQILSPSAAKAQGVKGYIRWDWRDM
tara:strand:- start:176 stop:508 length:333 start_codon:yes stop_codon:yes gene_type:complete